MFRSFTFVSAVLLLGSVANAQSGAKSNLGAAPRTAASSKSVPATTSAPVNIHELIARHDLQPFTHASFIPADSDLRSIRLEQVKLVTIPLRTKSTTDVDYCKEAALRDAAGSSHCPYVEWETVTRAYRVTFSFEGRPLESDEYGNGRFTFSLYFRPDEFSPAEQQALRKASRTNLAEFFEVATSRNLETREVVDYNNSRFCEGWYQDGVWVRTNSGCEDTIKFKTVSTSSDYVKVTVNPAPESRRLASASIH